MKPSPTPPFDPYSPRFDPPSPLLYPIPLRYTLYPRTVEKAPSLPEAFVLLALYYILCYAALVILV